MHEGFGTEHVDAGYGIHLARPHAELANPQRPERVVILLDAGHCQQRVAHPSVPVVSAFGRIDKARCSRAANADGGSLTTPNVLRVLREGFSAGLPDVAVA